MRLLLDTHVFLWLQTDPGRLGDRLSLVDDPQHDLLLSAASGWEIAIKHGLGRLALPQDPASYVPDRVRAIGARTVAIEMGHALAVTALPALHRDPFDRIIVAQARQLDATIVTADELVAQYPVRCARV